jgi:hypothetical protein
MVCMDYLESCALLTVNAAQLTRAGPSPSTPNTAAA